MEDEDMVEVGVGVGVGEVRRPGQERGVPARLPPPVRAQPKVPDDELLMKDMGVVEVEPDLDLAAGECGEDVAVDLVVGRIPGPPVDAGAIRWRRLVLHQVRVVENQAYGLARETLSDQRFGDRRRVELLDGDVHRVLGCVDEAHDLGLEVVGGAESAGATNASILRSAKVATG